MGEVAGKGELDSWRETKSDERDERHGVGVRPAACVQRPCFKRERHQQSSAHHRQCSVNGEFLPDRYTKVVIITASTAAARNKEPRRLAPA